MQHVLIDTFIVPEDSKDEFLAASRRSAEFIRTLPGFVDGYIFEKIAGEGVYDIVTTAVWESQDALSNAQQSAIAEFQRRGFNPREIMARLNVTVQRAIYKRSAY
jgi:heme-degrading monooxygenase HmoA